MGASPVVRAARRPTGGLFSAAQTISDPGAMADHLGVSGGGDTTVIAWRQADRVRAAIATGTGAFEMQNPVSAGGEKTDFPQVAVAPSGAAVMAWRRYDANGYTLRTAARRQGEAFALLSDVVKTDTKGNVPFGVHLVMAPSGRATMAWQFAVKQASGLSKYQTQWASRGISGDFGPAGNLTALGDRPDADFGLAVSADDTAAIGMPSYDGVRAAFARPASALPHSPRSRDLATASTPTCPSQPAAKRSLSGTSTRPISPRG